MISSIWRFEKIPGTEEGLQRWKTEGLYHYNLPELGIHLHIQAQQDIIKAEALQVLKKMTIASLEGLKVADGQMIKGIHRFPIFIFKALTPDKKEYMQIVISDPMGNYPWDPKCEADYKQQTNFTTDKVFYLVTQNKWQVNQLRKSIMLRPLAPDFKKRADGYIEPVQYIVNNELFATGAVSTRGGLIAHTQEVSWMFGLNDVTVICRDTDYSDPINKYFKAYKKQYLDKE